MDKNRFFLLKIWDPGKNTLLDLYRASKNRKPLKKEDVASLRDKICPEEVPPSS